MLTQGRGGSSEAKFRISLGLLVGALMDVLAQEPKKSVYHLCKGDQGMAGQASCGWCGRHGDRHSQERQTRAQEEGAFSSGNSTMKGMWRKDGVFLYCEDNTGVIVNSKGKTKGSTIAGPIAKQRANLGPRITSNAGSIV
ncbi:60S ribosomal protein L23 [Tupaia chinensis]|uniref:Large ribosomal subunit protein uL14 n=1 Tax=Tupaia chinensis TaxID=246437 RepID=L9L4R4_TUPCH|nr:60S ribosomal protein L23 [Tupaia chinensis]